MSLDLDGKSGRAHNTAALAVAVRGSLAAITAATFDSGDFDTAGNLLLQVDTAAGNADLNTLPLSLTDGSGAEALVDGVRMTVIKVTSDGNRLLFTDPVTGIVYSYADRCGESLSLVFDTSVAGGQWVAEI